MLKRDLLFEKAEFSLRGALARVEERAGRSQLPSEVLRSFYQALCAGSLAATGDIEDFDGNILAANIRVSPEYWRDGISEFQFAEACGRQKVFALPGSFSDPRGPFFVANVRIATDRLDDWMLQGTLVGSASDQAECAKWLRQIGPQQLSKKGKGHWVRLAKARFPILSKRAFARAWEQVAVDFPQISKPGRKPKG